MRLRLTRAVAVVAALSCGSLSPALAQEPSTSHLAAARELFIASGAAATIDRIMPVLVEDIRRVGVTRPEMAKDLEDVINVMRPEFEKQKQQGYAVAATSYARFLTESECNDAAAFFRSPTGAKYAKVQPEVTESLINNVTAWSQLAAEYVMTRVRSEMLKRGHQMQ